MKAIINMTTAFLLLLMFLFGWSLVTYNQEPLKYQWLDVNGEFKTSSYDITVSYNLDTPLDDLNGHSLNDIFLDGNLLDNHDFANDINGWGTIYSTISWSNGKVLYTNTSDYRARIGRSMDILSGHKYYFNWFFDTNDTITSGRIYLGSYLNVSYDNGFNSFIGTSTVNYPTFIHRIKFATTTESVLIDDYHAVDMTDYGIENLTQEQMDYWYSEYQRLQENQIENYKELGSTVESSWQFLTGYFTTLVDILDAQVQVILNPFEALVEGLTIITVPIFG